MDYRTKQIQNAIADCDRYIAKEGARAADLRPASAQQHLDYCVAHRAKLAAMLECSK